jgi:hypothetical protein
MGGEDNIWRAVDDTKPFARKTFNDLVTNGFELLRRLSDYAQLLCSPFQRTCAAIESLTSAKTEKNRQLCLGEVVELIAHKSCYYFPD